MGFFQHLNQEPALKYAFISYFLLGSLDTLHHFHAAIALGQSSALHAVYIGVFLIPASFSLVTGYLHFGKAIFLWSFFAISAVAIVFPGFYHGGWEHLLKVLGFLRIDSEYTNIHSLLPTNKPHLWFYEITGSLEFLLALISSYFLYFSLRETR